MTGRRLNPSSTSDASNPDASNPDASNPGTIAWPKPLIIAS